MAQNEFKFSALRQFGSENISFTATLHSDNLTLTDDEIQGQLNQVSVLIEKAFIATQEREISEKALLVAASDRRRVEVEKLDAALKAEMDAKSQASDTMRKAEKLSDKLTRHAKGN